MRNWQNLRLREEDLASSFSSGDNVGLLTGEPSGGLTDVDLDCPQAIVLARHFLPSTDRIHGRTSKPSSHWWYVSSPPPRPLKFRDADGTTLAEIRSSGQQTIVPPSTHPGGESLVWERAGEPSEAGDLVVRVSRLAAAALLARHWPQTGSRNDCSNALAGMLLRAGWSEPDCEKFIEAVAQAAQDDESRERVRDVVSTAKRLRAERPATGTPRLAQIIGVDVLDRVRDWLNVKTVVQAVTEPVAGEIALKDAIREVALDGEIPGFDKRRSVAELIVTGLHEHGRFLRTADGRAFFFHRVEGRLYDLGQTPFQHLLTTVSGLSSTESFFKFALDVLQAKVSRESSLVEVYSFSHFDPDTGMLAVSDGASGIWLREGGGEWKIAHNGDEGLLFLTEPDAVPWAPDFRHNGHARRWFLRQFLFAKAPLSVEDSQTLLHVWLAQLFFPPLRQTRVIPTFLGPQGSGKTTAERLVGRLLLGPKFQVTGLQRDKQDGFVAAVTNRVVLGLDNADSSVPWLPDSLALYATGQRYRLRQFYKTNEEVAYDPRAILMISSRDPWFNRPDVTERLLLFYFDRPAAYRTEEVIFRELESQRGAIMGSLLTHVGEVADALPAHPAKPLAFRMADFASFGERIFARHGKSTEWTDLLGRLERSQAAFASEGDGVIAALAELLGRDCEIREMAVGTLFSKCASIAEARCLLFPKSAQAFGRRLSSLRRAIELELGVKLQEALVHAGTRIISLIPRHGDDGGEGDDSGEKVVEVARGPA